MKRQNLESAVRAPLGEPNDSQTETSREGPSRSSSLAGLLLLNVGTLLLYTHVSKIDSTTMDILRAFSEAALVGGIADWFAVTALFRRPAGLPIPHTAILPRNQERVARGVSEFVADNFFSTSDRPLSEARAREILESALSHLSSQSTRADISRSACTALGFLLKYVEHTQAGRRALHSLFQRMILHAEVADVIADGLELLFENPHQKRAVSEGLKVLVRGLQYNRESLIEGLSHVGPWFVPHPVSRTIATVITDKTEDLLQNMISNEQHPSRGTIRKALLELLANLRSDQAWRAQLNELRNDIVANVDLSSYSAVLGAKVLGVVQQDISSTSSRAACAIEEVLEHTVEALQHDEESQRELTALIQEVSQNFLLPQRATVRRTVHEVIMSWDSSTFVGRIEGYVRQDLQYLRVNGTIVGGLVGIALYFLGLA